jgi:uncharacterized protein
MPIQEKPSRNEDEYFAKQDADLLKERRQALDAERAKSERRAHFMKCPKCGADLKEMEFHHIKIDKCTECGGLWFDKGEVEMLEHVDQSAIRGFVRSMFGLK